MFTPTRGFRLFLCAALPLLLAGMAAASVSVKVTNPSSSTASVPLTTTISAQASSGSPITGWYIYVDNNAVWHTGTATSSISASITMSSGTHKVDVRAWDSTGAWGNATLSLTASGSASGGGTTSGGGPTAPSTAKVWSNIEKMTGWGSCTVCAANPSDPTPPTANYSVTQNVASPSLDGASIKFTIWGGTAYGDALHWIKFGKQDAYRNFIWDFWVNGNSASVNAQNLEFDFFQVAYGRKYMFGSQCNYHNGLWQIWNENNVAWVNTSVPCHKFQPGVWTHVVWYGQRTSTNQVKYVSLTVGGTTYTLNAIEPSKATSWGDTLGVQYQQDLNSSATGYSIWVDKIKLSAW